MRHIAANLLDREMKKGSAEMLILSLVQRRPRHGYEIGKLIEGRSGGVVRFNVASLYPLLYRLEERGFVEGRWVETAGHRPRRSSALTARGWKTLREQVGMWRNLVKAMRRITASENA